MSYSPIRLMDAHDIRMLLGGVSRQRAYHITGRSDFPQPVADLAQGRIWLTRDVEIWFDTRRRHTQPGLKNQLRTL
ncbi:DNA-binding protein [Actinoplanes sp. G11-F43]|uniref:DNA-binding protein n=1 Tax=Actinoplanes sp. G11-F43 TaxID=3424130 RepID=UPI003D348CCD